MKNLIRKVSTMLVTTVLVSHGTMVMADDLQTLKNLERERTGFIEAVLDTTLTAEQRNKKIESKTRRLVDLERMALRDRRLEGKTDPMVRRAFKSYDMTFLAHASVEQDQHIAGHWYDQIGLSNEAILNARKGIR